jgi:hypothetical protein
MRQRFLVVEHRAEIAHIEPTAARFARPRSMAVRQFNSTSVFRHFRLSVSGLCCVDLATDSNSCSSMTVIKRGIGLTPTEKNLTALADKIFLNLWAYRISSRTTAKRCATCSWSAGDDVLIFSDKEITWQKGDNFDLSWSRWYRGAIEESAKQINGAARYLRDHYDQLFLDAACTEKFPLILPPLDRRRVHHIAVALGASEACADYYKKVPGYFPIAPDLKGKSHIDTAAEGFMPFAIGDVHPESAFIHVFNEPALELLGHELDTVTDFTRYLTRRERIIRSGHLLPLAGEHELLATIYSLATRTKSMILCVPAAGNGGKMRNFRFRMAPTQVWPRNRAIKRGWKLTRFLTPGTNF